MTRADVSDSCTNASNLIRPHVSGDSQPVVSHARVKPHSPSVSTLASSYNLRNTLNCFSNLRRESGNSPICPLRTVLLRHE